nr:HSP=25 kda major heat shock protein {N-terminal} [Helicobacter pylori, ATCC43504, Peptide Partial, 20 aa] [Helicobacter pylori]
MLFKYITKPLYEQVAKDMAP